MNNKRVTFPYVTKGGLEVMVRLPSKFEVCGRCDGTGSHTNPNVDGNGITAEEWENDWDEDSRDGYMSGRYDVQCEICKGDRVTPVVDESRLTPLRRKMWQAIQKHQEQEAQWRAEDRQTRYWESGGRE